MNDSIGRTEQDRRIDIREARPDDGPALVRAIAAIDAETDFLGVPGERPPWADRAAQQLREWRERRAAVYMLALRDGEIVGYVGAFAGWFERNRGVLFIGVVGVRAAHWGQGIAKQMLAAIEAWARAHDMWRMELRVDTQNPRALPLYLKHGFVVEGTIPHAVAINGSWRQHHWMGMLLAADDAPRCKPVDLPRLAPPPDIDQVIFRPLRPEDAAALWTWEGAMLAETPFMMKRPAERLAVERLAKNLAEADGNPHRHEIVAAIERQGEPARIVGHGGAWVEPLYRMAHDSWVGVGVLRAYWGHGIGRRLAAMLEAWARERGVDRLSSAAQAHNTRGRRFAERLGFAEEVRMRRYVVLDGRVADRVRYGKLLAG